LGQTLWSRRAGARRGRSPPPAQCFEGEIQATNPASIACTWLNTESQQQVSRRLELSDRGADGHRACLAPQRLLLLSGRGEAALRLLPLWTRGGGPPAAAFRCAPLPPSAATLDQRHPQPKNLDGFLHVQNVASLDRRTAFKKFLAGRNPTEAPTGPAAPAWTSCTLTVSADRRAAGRAAATSEKSRFCWGLG